MKSILILMSTYNGEKYIKEQLDCIFHQKNVDVSLYVRDDNSTDNTIEILKAYQESYSLTFYKGEKNIGPAQSFRNLITTCSNKYDYYAYADQDDIWDLSKLEKAIKQLEENKSDIPLLWYCGLKRLDSSGKLSDYFLCDINKANNIQAVIETFATTNGCTMVFNRKLLDYLRLCPNGSIDMHDSWTNAVCLLANGKVICSKESLVKYRIHPNQVLGNNQKSINNLFLKYKKPSGLRWQTVRTLNSYLEQQNLVNNYVNEVANYKKSLLYKIKVVLKKRPKCLSKKEDLKFKIQIILNKY